VEEGARRGAAERSERVKVVARRVADMVVAGWVARTREKGERVLGWEGGGDRRPQTQQAGLTSPRPTGRDNSEPAVALHSLPKLSLISPLGQLQKDANNHAKGCNETELVLVTQ